MSAVSIRGLTKILPVAATPAKGDRRERPARSCRKERFTGCWPKRIGQGTTLKVLGLATPTRGESKIFGEDSRDYRSHRSVGFLPKIPTFTNS